MEHFKKFLYEGGLGALFVWGFRFLLIGVFFWLKAEFVSKDKYLEDQGKQIAAWTELTKTLTHIDDTLVQLDKKDDDKEKRIRELEHEKK